MPDLIFKYKSMVIFYLLVIDIIAVLRLQSFNTSVLRVCEPRQHISGILLLRGVRGAGSQEGPLRRQGRISSNLSLSRYCHKLPI